MGNNKAPIIVLNSRSYFDRIEYFIGPLLLEKKYIKLHPYATKYLFSNLLRNADDKPMSEII